MTGPIAPPSHLTPAGGRPPGLTRVNRTEYEMAYSGVQTFLKWPMCMTPEDLRTGGVDVAVGGVPWDGTTTGRTGTHLGPYGIRHGDYITDASRLSHLDVRVDPLEHLVLCDYGDADVLIGDPEATYAAVRTFVAEILDGGAMPIILGGDRTITWPSATAVADAYGHGRLGILQFGAHPVSAPGRHGAWDGPGSPIHRLIESGAVPGRNVVQFGLRGYTPQPAALDWLEEQQVRSHFMAEIRRDGFDTVLDRAIDEALDSADHLYLSVDIGAADPAFAPGTGTPEPGGLTADEMMTAMRRVAAEAGIVAMDVLEVSPPYDPGVGRTAQLARRCVLEALVGTAMRKVGLTERRYMDPRATGTQAPRTFRTGAVNSVHADVHAAVDAAVHAAVDAVVDAVSPSGAVNSVARGR
ncbi:agmatinase [Kitasatospora kazusensis]|uniref:Agmatinase n=1 Tax=Kitasatospora kazusensis TaxID=407974 RepID=A0ABP5L211_9ACTN